MASAMRAYGKKALSWLLTFNCLLTIVLAVGLLTGFYTAHWKLYQPYLLNANLLWATILTSIMNFFPTVNFGHVKVLRLRFHHFVYGLAIFAASTMFIMVMSFSLLSLFTVNITNVNFNVGRILILVGLTLIIDDFADISNITTRGLRFMKSKTYQKRRIIHAAQCLLCSITFFVFLCIAVWLIQTPGGQNLKNLTMDGSLLATSLTAFGSVRKKTWLKITPQIEAGAKQRRRGRSVQPIASHHICRVPLFQVRSSIAMW
jgi:hypothetical protein